LGLSVLGIAVLFLMIAMHKRGDAEIIGLFALIAFIYIGLPALVLTIGGLLIGKRK
jgi:hypothetical protein